MTRKEEKEQAAFNEVGHNIYDNYFKDIFIKGAEWADKTMIDKACEWLKNDMIKNNAFSGRLERTKIIDGIIDNFRKAMEE